MSDLDTTPEAPEQEPVQITHIGLSLPLVNGIVGYLGQRPYAEVRDLINAIEQESQVSVQAQLEANAYGMG